MSRRNTHTHTGYIRSAKSSTFQRIELLEDRTAIGTLFGVGVDDVIPVNIVGPGLGVEANWIEETAPTGHHVSVQDFSASFAASHFAFSGSTQSILAGSGSTSPSIASFPHGRTFDRFEAVEEVLSD